MPHEAALLCEKALSELGERAKVSQIAFFGGSFTAIERGYMIALLEAVQPYISENGFSGIRISTRPDAIDEEILSLLKHYNVTAIELGAQSMNDKVLAMNLRGHTAKQVEDSAKLIKGNGFDLGLQMMTGLYGDKDEYALETAKQLAALNPDTMRIYPTVVLKGSQLEKHFQSGEYNPQKLDEAVNLCAQLIIYFESKSIDIIRVGLHASELVSGQAVAGAYHPAFRELCESKIYFDAIRNLIKESANKSFTVYVGNRYISRANGHKRQNINAFAAMGIEIKIAPDDSLGKYELRLNEN